MKGDYPGFKVTYTDEELAEHFLLTPAERTLVETCRGDVNRHSVAVLLKAVQYLGYFPEELSQAAPVGPDDTVSAPSQHSRCAPGLDSAAHGLPLSH